MYSIPSITAFHRLLSLPDPVHPLVSVIEINENLILADRNFWNKFSMDIYQLSIKRDMKAKLKYGQRYYDFDKGVMSFIAPKQVHAIETAEVNQFFRDCGSGYILLFHPDFLYQHPLASKIHQYGFFDYAVNEALHLSDKEEQDVLAIVQKIAQEYIHIDRHTQDIILAQLELLLHYCDRFYQRQFLTRKLVNHDLLTKMEYSLNNYFDQQHPLKNGLPTVEYLADQLHVSPHYLSDMLRTITGQNTLQHIHNKLIDKAKEYLASTQLSVAEIAYQLGFERPQSFNKLFKKKTASTPLAFRASFR